MRGKRKILKKRGYAKLTTVATTLSNEAGLFPADYTDIHGIRTQESSKTSRLCIAAAVLLN